MLQHNNVISFNLFAINSIQFQLSRDRLVVAL